MFSAWRTFIALGLVVVLVAGGGLLGYALANSQYQPQLRSTDQRLQEQGDQLSAAKQELSQQQAKVEQLTQAQEEAARQAQELDRLRGQLESAQGQLDELTGDLATVLARLDLRERQLLALLEREDQGAQLLQVVEQMGHDRQLLSELRKEVPSAREDAVAYWRNIKKLAAQSDPRLAPKVDQVLIATRNFFDWEEQAYVNEEERSLAFFLSGAYLLSSVTTDFINSVFLTVVTRMDAALQMVQVLQ